MKRPLLWAVLWFAFGEVSYLIASSIKQTGMLIWMPVCFVFVLVVLFKGLVLCYGENLKTHAIKVWLLLLSLFIIGFGWAFYRMSGVRLINDLYEKSYDCGAIGLESDEVEICPANDEKDKTVDWIIDKGKIYVRCYGKIEDVTDDKMLVYVEYTKVGGEVFDEHYKVYINSWSGISEDGHDNTLMVGKYIVFSGVLNQYETPTNPGGFDRRKYYVNQQIMGCFKGLDSLLVTEVKVGWFDKLVGFLQNIKNKAISILENITDSDTAAILSGIILGDKSEIATSIRRLYQVNGIAHILAISGLHISLIGGFVYKLIRRIGLGFLPAASLSIVLIICYGLMTGFKVATIRAVIMLSIYLFGQVLGRTYDLPTGMAVALLFVLIDKPGMILDGGTQLSFGAIVGVLLAQYLNKHCSKWMVLKVNCLFKNIKSNNNKINNNKNNNKPRYIILRKLLNSLLFSFSVNIMTLPIICYLYYEFPLYSIILNLIVIPLMTLVVLSGIIPVVFCIALWETSLKLSVINFGGMLIKPAEWILHFFEFLCDKFLDLPYATINVGKVTLFQILVYYSIVVFLLIIFNTNIQRKLRELYYRLTYKYPSKKNWRITVVAFSLIFVFFGGTLIYYLGQDLRGECIVFMDVGQGDGVLIRFEKGTNVVVDGGSSTNSAESLGEYVIIPSIKYMGMANVDYWFVSHTDADHMNGLEYIISNGKSTGIKIKNLVLSKYIEKDADTMSLINLATESGINIIWTYPGAGIFDGDASLITCHPNEEFSISKDKNQCSLALAYLSKDISMLMLADMDDDAIDYMLEHELELGMSHVTESKKMDDMADVQESKKMEVMEKAQLLSEKNKEIAGHDDAEGTYDVARVDPHYYFDIIKLPHHGSKNSLSERLYKECKFSSAVISCGKGNRYGHPHEETLEKLDKIGAQVFRTDESGAIEVRIKGDNVEVLQHGDDWGM